MINYWPSFADLLGPTDNVTLSSSAFFQSPRVVREVYRIAPEHIRDIWLNSDKQPP